MKLFVCLERLCGDLWFYLGTSICLVRFLYWHAKNFLFFVVFDVRAGPVGLIKSSVCSCFGSGKKTGVSWCFSREQRIQSMSKRVVGLSSALDGDSDASDTSAVSSIASRFNASGSMSASADEEGGGGNRVSEKVSDIATRFGKTVDQAPTSAASSASSRQRLPQIPRVTSPRAAAGRPPARADNAASAGDTERVVAERPGKVNDVAKRFAGGAEEDNTAAQQGGFASAHDRFRRAEEAERRPSASRVSSFARAFESGAHASFDADDSTDRHVAGVARTFESKGTERENTSRQPSVFDNAASKFQSSGTSAAPQRRQQRPLPAAEGRDPQPPPEQLESLEQRFANATKLFESGAASTKPIRAERPTLDSHDPDEKSPQSRFADAARVFGGS